MLPINRQKIGSISITIVSLISIVGVYLLGPVEQDPGYHVFIDRRIILGVPNFWNVISNLAFLLVGLMGLHGLLFSPRYKIIGEMREAYILFFIGVTLVALGSGYYHISPDNASLVWDRLPMTIAFMALFSVIIGEFISVRLAQMVLWPLVVLGALSVFYWYYTELTGTGDLRVYILVQYLPMMIAPLIMLFFKSGFTRNSGYWFMLSAYLLAKVFESFDGEVFNMLTLLSGHTLKHLTAAVGILFLLHALYHRSPEAEAFRE